MVFQSFPHTWLYPHATIVMSLTSSKNESGMPSSQKSGREFDSGVIVFVIAAGCS